MTRLLLLVPLLLALAACGDLPQPFLGNPGATAMRLRQPPDPRLAIPAPATALLSDDGARLLAGDLAARLQQGEVPAYAKSASPTDWKLLISALNRGTDIVPQYTVLNPQGQPQGSVSGHPVPAAAWANAEPTTIHQVALDAAPGIASLLTRIEGGLMRADPNSLYNRVARVDVPEVTGAPGDGNSSLTKQMRDKLVALGPQVSPGGPNPDFTIQGQVKIVPIPGGKQRVEIQWIISDAKGKEAGRVIQLNEIPAGILDRYWGDVAVVVAQEAAGGVNEVIRKRSGKEPPPSS